MEPICLLKGPGQLAGKTSCQQQDEYIGDAKEAPGLNFAKPFSGGSESVEAAFKFARQYFRQSNHPHKHKFVSVYRGYHGGTFGAMAASGTGKRTAKFEPLPGGFLKVNGMSDIEALCDQAPIQIGNRVWIDSDFDGIQDPGETPVAGDGPSLRR